MSHFRTACVFCVLYILLTCSSQIMFTDSKLEQRGCEWGTWLPWDCVCCGQKVNFPAYRSRTKCCMDTTNCKTFGTCNITSTFVADKGFIEAGYCLKDCPSLCNNKSLNMSPCRPKVNKTEKITARELEFSCSNFSEESVATSFIGSGMTIINETTFQSHFTFSSSKNGDVTPSSSTSNSSSTVYADHTSHDSYVNCPTPTTRQTSPSTSFKNSTEPVSTTAMDISVISTETVVSWTTNLWPWEKVSQKQEKTTGGSHNSIGLILGVSAGCIAGLVIVTSITILLKRKKFKSPVEPEPETIERQPEENRVQSPEMNIIRK